ncbi:MAG: acyl-ACP thioesterase domain-containing protein [Bacteroidota bacterium]
MSLRPDAPLTWTDTYTVRAYETDPSGEASVLTLCNYLQETAGSHAEALGVVYDPEGDPPYAWVLSRLTVRVRRSPRWRERVHLETWPAAHDGRLYADRAFLLRDDDGHPLLHGLSAWLVFDLARRRPVRLPAEIRALQFPDRALPVALPEDKLPLPEAPTHTASFEVRYSDLDVNRHTNNVRYLAWAIETLPKDLHTSHRLTEATLDFRAETVQGDRVDATATVHDAPDGALRVAHGLRLASGREVVAAETHWAPR